MRPTEAERPNTVSQCSPYPVPILSSPWSSFEHYRLREPTNLSFVEEQESRKVIYTKVDTLPGNRTDNFFPGRLFTIIDLDSLCERMPISHTNTPREIIKFSFLFTDILFSDSIYLFEVSEFTWTFLFLADQSFA